MLCRRPSRSDQPSKCVQKCSFLHRRNEMGKIVWKTDTNKGFPCYFCSQIEHIMTVDGHGPICSMIPTGILRVRQGVPYFYRRQRFEYKNAITRCKQRNGEDECDPVMPSACELPGRNGQGRLRLRAVSLIEWLSKPNPWLAPAASLSEFVDRAVRTDKLSGEHLQLSSALVLVLLAPHFNRQAC
jgi:hypothetical protein